MSETEALGGEIPIDDSGEQLELLDGAADVADETVEPDPEPVYDYLEVDDPTSKYVKVTVDGEEQSVPYEEALQGYQRTADYTRKTQELAEQRRQAEEALQIQQAMHANPGLTVQVLAAQQGLSVEQYLGLQQQQQYQPTDTQPEVEYDDPLERQLAEERQARLALEQRLDRQDANQTLMRAVDGLKQSYGIDDDAAKSVVGEALKMGLGPEAFPMIYQSQAYQRLAAQQQAQQEAQQQKTQKTQQRQQAAARATQQVSAGAGAANVTTAAPSQQPQTAREAIEMAFEQIESQARR